MFITRDVLISISSEDRSVLVPPVSILEAEVAWANPTQLDTSLLANSLVTGEAVVVSVISDRVSS